MKHRIKEVSFGNTAVKSLLFSSMSMLFVTYASTVASTLIAGKIVGNNALSAINLVSPLYNYASFVSGMIGIGSSLMFFRYMGAYKKERADKIFGQGIILAVVSGILIFIAMTVGKEAYLNSLEVSEAVRIEAECYWRFEKLFMALAPLDFLLFEMLCADTRLIIIADIVFFVSGIGSSVLLTSVYGTMGTSLGMTIGTVMCDLVLCSHFLKKNNEFTFVPHISLKDIKNMIQLALVDSSTYLDSGLLITFINYFVIKHFSEEMLPIAAAMITILDMVVVFDCVGSAFAPVAEVYLGEENYQNEKGVAKYSLGVAVKLGAAAALFFIIAAPLFPELFEIKGKVQAEVLISSIRLFAPSMLFYSISYMLISHYVAIRKITVAVLFEWIKAFIMPAICIVIFGKLFGFRGIWGGFVPAEIVATIGFVAIISFFSKGNKSIWLLGDNDYPTFTRSYVVSESTFATAMDDIEKFLMDEQISRGVILKVMMTVEEMTNIIYRHNPGKKVIIQYDVSVHSDCLYLYERDTGEEYELTNSDMDISSFSEYIFSCVIESCNYKKYLLSIGYNRSIFSFKL